MPLNRCCLKQTKIQLQSWIKKETNHKKNSEDVLKYVSWKITFLAQGLEK